MTTVARDKPVPDNATASHLDGKLADILVTRGGRTFTMLGPAGPARELAFLPQKDSADAPKASAPNTLAGNSLTCPQTSLPVLIGSGAGHALAELAARLEAAHGPNFCLAVVDKEEDILRASRLPRLFANYPGMVWLHEPDSGDLINALTRWQTNNNGLPMQPVTNPFYLRLDKKYYSAARDACQRSACSDFWTRAYHARFVQDVPRILLMTSTYFLMGEIRTACERLAFPHRLLQLPEGALGQQEFITRLLTAIVEFRPDFIFTINHLGVDCEGVLVDLLEKLRLPLVSWFVDNPHLILYRYSRLKSPWTTIMTWDADNIASLSALGFENVSYLPLGADTVRFHPPAESDVALRDLPSTWNKQVAFVGNSMAKKVLYRQKKLSLPPALADNYQDLAACFGKSDERSVSAFLAAKYPRQHQDFMGLDSIERKLDYETLLTWEATRQYRYSCLKSVFDFAPLIVGDEGWKSLIPAEVAWHYHSELGYYDELPAFYPQAAINFNCTSKQMKGAVNQRVFDVPATGSFLLTDYREQVENLFEPEKEIICYHSAEEATHLASEFLTQPKRRKAIADAARQRVLAEHTYEHRLRTLSERMRAIYA